MGQMNSVYAFPPFFHKMYSNSIVLSMDSRQSDPSLQMVKMKTQQETILFLLTCVVMKRMNKDGGCLRTRVFR
jgi:hypothetical protein